MAYAPVIPDRNPLVALLDRITKGHPGAPVADDTTAHILRLAETSPHLLEDLGFAPDPRTSTLDATVWTNGTHRLRIRTDRSAALV